MRDADELPERDELHLKDYLHVLDRHKWLILVVVAASLVWAALRTFREKPVYQAAAQILIERETPNIVSIEQVMQVSEAYQDFYNTQYRVLQSASLASAVAGKLRIWEYPEFGGGARSAGAGRVLSPQEAEARLEAAAAAVQGRIAIEPVKDSFLVNIKASAFDPKLAALIANTLAEIYIEQNLRLKVDTTQQAGSWLNEQTAETRKKLADAERALQHFNEENNVISLEERQANMTAKLMELNTELSRTRVQRQDLESRIEKIRELRKKSGDGTAAGVEYYMTQFATNTTSIRDELNSLETDLAEQTKVYGPKHPKIVSLTSKIQALRKKLTVEAGLATQGMNNEYQIALKREKGLQELIAAEEQRFQTLNAKGIEHAALKREVESTTRIYELIASREKETNVLSGIRTNNIRMVDRARVPGGPVSPNHPRALGMGLVVGLIGALGLVIFLEYLDDTVTDPDVLMRLTRVPFLGPVPFLEPKVEGDKSRDLLAMQEPKSVFAEAYRAVRTNMLFSSPDNPPRTFVFTSPGQQEGKTVTAINLAITMALTGKQVLLVDADLRKPRIHKVFELDNVIGLSNLIRHENEIDHALHPTAVPSLSVMTAGPTPPNPSELLGSARLGKLLEMLRERFDIVILDCTPLLAVTDSTVLATQADGVILVVKSGATRKKILQRGIKQLEDVQAKIIGIVLNLVNVRKSAYYYSSYYAHYYGEKEGLRSGGFAGATGRIRHWGKEKSETPPAVES